MAEVKLQVFVEVDDQNGSLCGYGCQFMKKTFWNNYPKSCRLFSAPLPVTGSTAYRLTACLRAETLAIEALGRKG